MQVDYFPIEIKEGGKQQWGWVQNGTFNLDQNNKHANKYKRLAIILFQPTMKEADI